MDGELVSDYPSSNGESEDNTPLRLSVKYTDKFNELFPFYLAIGMSYEQYWEMDSTLVKSYRTAYEIKQDIINQQLFPPFCTLLRKKTQSRFLISKNLFH